MQLPHCRLPFPEGVCNTSSATLPEAAVPNAHFLETYPLYRRWKFPAPATMDALPKVQINMLCVHCGAVRTFVMVNDYWVGFGYTNHRTEGQIVQAKYTCVSCRKFDRYFAIEVAADGTWFRKVGQNPPWETAVDADISAMLGTHKDYLQKGMICESQGYGIAAFAYYRRIVEETIDSLLEKIEGLMPDAEREAFSSALTKVKTTRVAAEKIELVQDLLPAILRPDNMNPLALLHGVLSEGLHAESDERCLELAVEVREILTFLASQVATASRSAQAFTGRMRSLLEKRVGPAGA